MSPDRIRLLLVDDDPNVLRGLTMRLALTPDIAIVGEAPNGDRALGLAGTLRPAVIVLDVNMPGLNGVHACTLLRTPITAVVILSIESSDALRARCREAGAAAFVSKHEPFTSLLRAIRNAASGTAARRPVSPREADSV